MFANRFTRRVATAAAVLCGVLAWNCCSNPTQAREPQSPPPRLDAATLWVVAPDEPEALHRALRDVENDWYKVFGRLPSVVAKPPEKWSAPVVCFGLNAPWLKMPGRPPYAAAECFSLRLEQLPGGPALMATGADLRGAIYAAYAVSEELLGVDPWYFWVDHEPSPKPCVVLPAAYARQWGPPRFKYRGWFINDEDLLSHFAPAPLQDGVFSLDMWDRIYETLLRLRANTIVPGTFTFPDERMQVLAARRGLINSQHHICVVGLNTFQWPAEFPYSYLTHPGTLEQAWQVCVDALKDRETVWTVGFRGRHDRAFWADDPQVKTPEARGRLISEAIARQVAMVRRVQPQADCIANLWIEGVDLYKAGYLKLPPGVILVWPDDGAGWIRDQGEVRRGQGIYYHTAMLSGRHSQLTEIVPPQRIHDELTRFIKTGATSYFVVNTSDVRPVPLTTDYCMRLAWGGVASEKTPAVAEREYLADWSRRQFGPAAADALATLYGDYFATPYIQAGVGENKTLREIKRLVKYAMAAASPRKMPVKLARSLAAEYAPSTAHLAALAPKVRAMVERVPAERRDFFRAHLVVQVEVHHRLCNVLQSLSAAIVALGASHSAQAVEQLDAALVQYDAIIAALRDAEYGRWKGWYAGERFTELFDNQVRLQALRGKLKGEPEPIVRANPSYPELYHYQQQAKGNYPLFYPVTRRPLTPREMVRTLADSTLRDLRDPPAFNWGEGVLLTGMLRAHRLTGDARYLKFVQDFAAHWQRQGIQPLLNERGYCGHWGPGQALLELYELTKDRRDLELADEIASFIGRTAERTHDGGLSHFAGKRQLWDDTLFMVCPVLAPLGRISARPALLADAARQLQIFTAHLRDPKSGLLYHMWDEETGEHSPCFWGRGNGWVAMSYVEVLKNMPEGATDRPQLVDGYRKLLAALAARQDRQSGLWHTVLDDSASYGETSATAMILYSMIEGRRLHLLDATYDEPIQRAWAGLSTQVDNMGQASGVSGGTGPGDRESYLARPQGTYTWGTGAMLMAASAMAEAERGK